jgi:tripeptide aminopeptidase
MISIKEAEIAKLFVDLVKIDSLSGQEGQVAEFLLEKLEKLGHKCQKDAYGNLIAHIDGQGEPLFLGAHMDTVAMGVGIKPVILGDLITSNGKTILGADDKAGITEILIALEYLNKNKIIHRSLEIVFTKEEETGLFGAKNLDMHLINSKEGLVLDRSGHAQAVVIAAPFIASVEIEIFGRSAHAGSAEKGRSAIVAASMAIGKVKSGRIDSETTANFGIISGGEAVNAVAEKVKINAEIRSHSEDKVKKIIESWEKKFREIAKKQEVEFILKHELTCFGYKFSKNDPFILNIIKNWKSLGKEAVLEKAGGASDANEFARHGLKIVDIGYGGINPHTKQESIKISDMKLIVEFLINFVSRK